jgi:hypothetical protein
MHGGNTSSVFILCGATNDRVTSGPTFHCCRKDRVTLIILKNEATRIVCPVM